MINSENREKNREEIVTFINQEMRVILIMNLEAYKKEILSFR